jgi:hypothetical protein
MKNFYTIFCEYKGCTCVGQASARSKREAVKHGMMKKDLQNFNDCMFAAAWKSISGELYERDFTALNGLPMCGARA